jgi:hypothetical protein
LVAALMLIISEGDRMARECGKAESHRSKDGG